MTRSPENFWCHLGTTDANSYMMPCGQQRAGSGGGRLPVRAAGADVGQSDSSQLAVALARCWQVFGLNLRSFGPC
jgi:hypothetical protein